MYLSVPEIDLLESEIPYTRSSSIAEIFDDKGMVLTKGGATLSCPPGSLPQDTELSMTVLEVDKDDLVKGKVYVSPLVVIETEPHVRPSEPLTLFLPLQIHRDWPVRVKASHTAFLDSPHWIDLPPECVTTRSDGVDVLVNQFSIFRATCSPVDVVMIGNKMYFSVSSTEIGGGEHRLRVSCSPLPEYCDALGDFQPAHQQSETTECSVEVYPAVHLAVTLKTTDGSILQCGHSEVDEREPEAPEPLHTDFVINPIQLCSHPDEKPPEDKRKSYKWTVCPRRGSAVGYGELFARCKTCAVTGDVVEHVQHSKGKKLDFKIAFTGVSLLSERQLTIFIY